MNNQIRVLVVMLGAFLTIITYSFPLWYPYLNLLPGVTGTVFPGLPPQLSDAYLQLPPEQQLALETLAEEEPDLALQLALAHLRPDVTVPLPEQELPQMLGQVKIVLGDFLPSSDAVQVEGQLTIYELADSRKLVRFDDFTVTNVEGMSVYLSESSNPLTPEDMKRGGDYQLLGELQGNVGAQHYEVAAQIDLSRYNSIVIYSETLDYVVGYALFTIRL